MRMEQELLPLQTQFGPSHILDDTMQPKQAVNPN
jgi:hypothetical protein